MHIDIVVVMEALMFKLIAFITEGLTTNKRIENFAILSLTSWFIFILFHTHINVFPQ